MNHIIHRRGPKLAASAVNRITPTTRSLLLALLQPVEECVPLPPHLLRVGRGLPHRPLVHPPPRLWRAPACAFSWARLLLLLSTEGTLQLLWFPAEALLAELLRGADRSLARLHRTPWTWQAPFAAHLRVAHPSP